jgi:hypothetical protein
MIKKGRPPSLLGKFVFAEKDNHCFLMSTSSYRLISGREPDMAGHMTILWNRIRSADDPTDAHIVCIPRTAHPGDPGRAGGDVSQRTGGPAAQTPGDPVHFGPLGGVAAHGFRSGGATHNLPEIQGHRMTDPPVDYAEAFDAWLEEAIRDGRTASLLNYEAEGPFAARNHPWPAEHFLPLFAPLGAAGEGAAGRLLHRSFMYGLLSMAAYRWDG